MRELVDADSASLLTALTGGDATQQSEIVSRGNLAKSGYTAAAENVGPEARRVGILGGHTQVRKSIDDGEVKACWERCTQDVGRTNARTWVESIWS